MANAGVSSSSKAPRRGRRPATKVPCDGCILNASKSGTEANIQLCRVCLAVLNKSRRRQEAPNRRVRSPSHAPVDTTLGEPIDPPSLPWSSDKREQHALAFFIKHSAPQLAGYFDSSFWQHFLLEAARHEPAVRHAITAIGALHEKLLDGAVNGEESRDQKTRFALEQCNKSIQFLVKPSKPNLRLLLTTCILFTCFEALQGNCEQAIIHATQGYSLLQQHAADTDNERWDVGAFAVELDQVVALMRRLQTQSKGPVGRHLGTIPDTEQLGIQPTYFANLNEARSSLEKVLDHLKAFYLALELDSQYYDFAISRDEKRLSFAPWLHAWEGAFSALLSRGQPQMQERKAAMVLKAHHLVAEILASVDLSLGELGWDVQHDKFQAIVDLAAGVLDGSKQSDESLADTSWETNNAFISSSPTTLPFSLGIVDPLYEVVARCRDPALRRKALDLLARHPRHECMWSSWCAWNIGKLLLLLEEEGASDRVRTPSEIPQDQSITEAWLDFSDESATSGRGRVGYRRGVPRGSARHALQPGLFDWRREDTTIDSTTVIGAGRSKSHSSVPTSPPSVQVTSPDPPG